MGLTWDTSLVDCLFNRMTTKLPHRTRASQSDLAHDAILTTTRSTIVSLSVSSITLVLENAIDMLNNISPAPGKPLESHVLQSQIYVLALIADCCTENWNSVRAREKSGAPNVVPDPLDDELVSHILNSIKSLLEPFPENYELPSNVLLGHSATDFPRVLESHLEELYDGLTVDQIDVESLRADLAGMDANIETLVEFISASSWDAYHSYMQQVLYSLHTVPSIPVSGSIQQSALHEGEREALVLFRALSFTWADSSKIMAVLSIITTPFPFLKTPLKNTLALVIPLIIMRWTDRFPHEFVQLHTSNARHSATVETLFGMCNKEIPRARQIYAPMQTALCLLLPDVFEVASSMSTAKSSAMAARVAMLDGLRKAMRYKNQYACHCLVMLLRCARHFDASNDCAFSNFALDIQAEVRESVFRQFSPSTEGISLDQNMITAAFVALAYLDLEGVSDTLLENCLLPGTPLEFKLAVVQACKYFGNSSDPNRFKLLFETASPFIHRQLKAIADRNTVAILSDLSTSDVEPEKAMELMAEGILGFLEVSKGQMMYQSSIEDSGENNLLKSFLFCLISPNHVVRNLAGQVSCALFDDSPEAKKKRPQLGEMCTDSWREDYWRRSANVLIEICQNLDIHTSQTRLRHLEHNLMARILILKEFPTISKVEKEIPEVVRAASTIETTLFVLLCAVDINVCRLVTSCLGLFLQESVLMSSTNEDGYRTSLMRNQAVFEDLASKDFRFTGVVAFQKRTCKLLRSLQCPTPGILQSWVVTLDRWLKLSQKMLISPQVSANDPIYSEWRNCSGLLAAIGGICTAERAATFDDPSLNGLQWIDRVSGDHQDKPLLTKYLHMSIQLLYCHNPLVRNTASGFLTFEISPFLYQQLFIALEMELGQLFLRQLNNERSGDREIVFIEQAASLIKALVERLTTPADVGAAASINLGELALNFAKFMTTVADSQTALLAKIKICQLCEAVTHRKEYLNLRDDVRVRNQLLERIFGWIARPKTPRSDLQTPSSRHDETARMQKDLDRACLRCLTELTYRLPLQPPNDGQLDAGFSEAKSQLFQTYFNRFLSLLNYDATEFRHIDMGSRDDGTSISNLSIVILSNLLSANIDVGLKHSLNIGYHENHEIRTAFIRVLYNILMRGTEFNNLSDTAVSEKHAQLLDILTSDVSLAVALSVICPANEVDEMTISLLVIFEQKGKGFELIEALIRQEIEDTDSESEILRRNCVATKMLSIYAKWKGSMYLKSTLQKVVERLMLTTKDLNLELDPSRVSSAEELQNNAAQLRMVAKVFVDDICYSSANIPPSFCKICSIIASAVLPRFPNAKYTAVGAFIFLRFFCPAIVAPDVEGLVSTPPSKEMRRGLLLIAKVVQNLANNVLFGAKEPFMFPLNDFLTENIYRVTTFLRGISAEPEGEFEPSVTEWSEFGSCVSLHRFLYDHWDQFRQRLAFQDRRELARSPAESQRTRSPFVEPLRKLISNLGPPPMAVTWTKPMLSVNSPPSYANFHSFMLRNSIRSPESFLSSRAVYEGGESIDNMPIICVILRHIHAENADYDFIIYSYLKIASRLWGRKFGLFIDATCYAGHVEGPEDLFEKLDKLAPKELSSSLSRIYVHNMNSPFRSCLRRLLRATYRDRSSIFNPSNVQYYLLSDRQDLQAHFKLSKLHLPKETLTLVMDTRYYVFQPVTKLSRMRTPIDVTITVGSQFIQVTTKEKQEVNSTLRMSGIINDIFRVGEVEDTPSSTPPVDDDSGFGLRADNGKLVMHFKSPKTADITKAIRNAKARYGKDSYAHKTFDRLVRPQDVPGTLLNLALTNLSSKDHTLRHESYNLLSALCRAFKFSAANKLLCLKDISIPLDPAAFVLRISTELAASEPQLTQDFLTEFFVGWESASDDHRQLGLAYIAPWLPGLRIHLLSNDADGDKAREKVAVIIRKLVDVALTDHRLMYVMEKVVWPHISHDEVLSDILVDELIRSALKYAIHDDALETLASVAASIGTVTIRGKIIARLRKTLNRSSMRPTRYLPDNSVWDEICVLLRFCLSLSFDSGVQAQMWLPDIFHIVTMLVNTGSSEVRNVVHRLLINSLHSICTSFSIEGGPHAKLLSTIEYLDEPRSELFLPLNLVRDGASVTTTQDSATPSLAAIESLANLLIDVCAISAPNIDMANAWRARWMSLVSSTAFQVNPAIQPRAFTIMGCLAQGDVDDDLLYQVLVSLSSSISRFQEDGNADMLVSIITALSKMMAKLPASSRYGMQLFWLAISLLRFVPSSLFNYAAQLLEAFLTNFYISESMSGQKLVHQLLQARTGLTDACYAIDGIHGVQFTPDNFHFAICACLVRGLTGTTTRGTTMRVLSVFLDVMEPRPLSSYQTESSSFTFIKNSTLSPYSALMLSRCVGLEELNDRLWFPGMNPQTLDENILHWRTVDLESIKDKDLLLNMCIELVDFKDLDPQIQNRSLKWLKTIAQQRPTVFLHVYHHVSSILNYMLSKDEIDPPESAYELSHCLITSSKFTNSSTCNIDPWEALGNMGFDKIWSAGTYHEKTKPDPDFTICLKDLINYIIN